MRKPGLLIFLSIAACLATDLCAQVIDPPTPPLQIASEQHFVTAVEAVTQGNEIAALRGFDAALSTARRSPDERWSNDFQLKVAATIQSVESSPDLQEIAMSTYERVLADRPNSPIVWNNLAKLYSDSGRLAEADSLFRLAVAAGGEYERVFKLNYAEFVLDQGRPARAIRLYERILAEYPDDRRANDGLIQAYVADLDAARLSTYCWREIGRGNGRRIANIGMEVLPSLAWDDAGDGPRWGWHDEYVSIIAAALAKARYAPTTFLETDVGRRLIALASESEALDGLVRLYDPSLTSELNPESFDWWAVRGYDPFEEAGPISPRQSFRFLARQIASDYRAAGDRETADAYYTIAAQLSEIEVDPEAVLELAEMRFETGNTDGLDSLLAVYNPMLFDGKGAAYMLGDNARIYRYQRALGIMYGRLGRWGSDNQVGTANFHLKEAIKAAERSNETESSRHITVSPEIINLRARSLSEIGDAKSGLELQLRYAEKYTDEGKSGAAQSIYSGVLVIEKEVETSPELESRIRVLDAELKTAKTYRRPEK